MPSKTYATHSHLGAGDSDEDIAKCRTHPENVRNQAPRHEVLSGSVTPNDKGGSDYRVSVLESSRLGGRAKKI